MRARTVVTKLVLLGALLAGPAGAGEARAADAPQRKVAPAACSLDGMLADLRAALRTGSPAYRKYMRALLKEAALSVPGEQLRAAFLAERDPEVVEALGATLAARASRTSHAEHARPVLERARHDADPQARAAAVRALRGTGSVGTLEKLGGSGYEQWVRDASPEVRKAVVDNLVSEDAKIYFGHDRAVSETAVATALAAPEAEATELLRNVSMESVGHRAATQLAERLGAESAAMRAAAAAALGGVPGEESAWVTQSLVERYRADADRSVRTAILESLARLGLARAAPLLTSLRGVDPGLTGEIDAWLRALQLGLQEWTLVKREKQRIAGAVAPR